MRLSKRDQYHIPKTIGECPRHLRHTSTTLLAFVFVEFICTSFTLHNNLRNPIASGHQTIILSMLSFEHKGWADPRVLFWVLKKVLFGESTQKSAQKSTQKSTLWREHSKKCSKKHSKKYSKKYSLVRALKKVLKRVLKKVLLCKSTQKKGSKSIYLLLCFSSWKWKTSPWNFLSCLRIWNYANFECYTKVLPPTGQPTHHKSLGFNGNLTSGKLFMNLRHQISLDIREGRSYPALSRSCQDWNQT